MELDELVSCMLSIKALVKHFESSALNPSQKTELVSAPDLHFILLAFGTPLAVEELGLVMGRLKKETYENWRFPEFADFVVNLCTNITKIRLVSSRFKKVGRKCKGEARHRLTKNVLLVDKSQTPRIIEKLDVESLKRTLMKCRDEEKRFEDESFPADWTSLWPDKHPSQLPANHPAAAVVSWRRPHEIAGTAATLFLAQDNTPGGGNRQVDPNSPLTSTATPTCYAEGDLEGGASLKDTWFLSALEILSLSPTRNISGIFLAKYPQFGLYQCRFSKDGEWHVVVVDDRLPCDASGRPAFARSRNPNEFWVSILEKAYAKLHGSYAAILKGHTREALADLTGEVAEDVSLVYSSELWNLLVLNTKENWLMGCTHVDQFKEEGETKNSLSQNQSATMATSTLETNNNNLVTTNPNVIQSTTSGGSQENLNGSSVSISTSIPNSSVKSPSGTPQKQFSSLASQGVAPGGRLSPNQSALYTNLGILVNHAYAIMRCFEIGTHKILQLHNPWGLLYWRGHWSEGSLLWRSALMEQFQVNFDDDSTFYIEFADWCREFTHLHTLHLPSEEATRPLEKIFIAGSWRQDSAGGCTNFPSWTLNHQFKFNSTHTEPITVFLSLSHKDRRLTLKKPASTLSTSPNSGTTTNNNNSSNDIENLNSQNSDNNSNSVLTFDFDKEEGPAYPAHGLIVMKYTSPNTSSSSSIETSTQAANASLTPNPLLNIPDGSPNQSNTANSNLSLLSTSPAGYKSTTEATFRETGLPDSQQQQSPTPTLYKKDKATSDDLEAINTFQSARDNALEFTAQPNTTYIIIPATYNPGVLGSYYLRIHSKYPTRVVPLMQLKLNKSVEGSWQASRGTNGGSIHYPSWRNSPQFLLRVFKETHLRVLLQQADVKPLPPIAFAIFKADASERRKLELLDFVLLPEKFITSTSVSGDLLLAPGSYNIIAACETPEYENTFKLSIDAPSSSAAPPAAALENLREYKRLHLRDSWTADTAGGCRNHPTWVKNPHYLFTIPPPGGNVTIVVSFAEIYKEVALGYYLFNADAKNTRAALLGKSKFTHVSVSSTFDLAPGNYILLPCTFTPNIIHDYTIEFYSDLAITTLQK